MRTAIKTLSILGATGSVGQSTLDLVRHTPEQFKVVALTAHSRVKELADAAIEFNAELAVIGQADKYEELQALLAGTNTRVAAGSEALF
jgi:1-deoxy-D-xylulose-5-phosphate reductoisomerase